MLKKQITQYFADLKEMQPGADGKIEVYKEEFDYAERHQLINDEFKPRIRVNELTPVTRFGSAYIERSDKELEKFLGEESFEFLNQPIDYLKKHLHEFIYMESDWFEIIGVDAVSFEVDDVFGTYDVMLGLKLQKKYDKTLKALLNDKLQGDDTKFDLLFNNEDGLWNLNFALNNVEGFDENMTLGDAFLLIYRFVFNLAEQAEESN